MKFVPLIEAAMSARENAHAKYSRFKVGAAVETLDGRIFTGCNIENLSFGLTICAERVAVFSAIAAGCNQFSRIVIVADSREPISPCGACRQVLAEFSDRLQIRSVNLAGNCFEAELSELLPRAKSGILG